MELLIELDRTSSQIEILAVELSTAIHAADLDRASRQLDELRDQVERASTAVTALKIDTEFVGATATVDAVLDARARSRPREDGGQEFEIASKERVLAERLIAVLVQLARLRHLEATMESARFAGGLMQLDDFACYVHEQLGRLNAAWICGKRTDRAGALAQAHDALKALREHRGVARFLREASRLESMDARTAAIQLAALIEARL